MYDDLKTLARLQITEDRITEASKARDELAAAVEQQELVVRGLTKKRNEVQDQFDVAKRAWREVEESVDTKKAELKTWEQRLQTLTDWREQQALNSAIRDHKRGIERGEAEASEKVEGVEALEEAFNAAQGALEDAQAKRDELAAALTAKTAETEAALTSELAHRENLLGEIGDTDSRRFINIVTKSKKRPARAVVVASDGVCGFCNVSLQPQSWIEVQRKEKVIYCQTCRRAAIHETVMDAGREAEA